MPMKGFEVIDFGVFFVPVMNVLMKRCVRGSRKNGEEEEREKLRGKKHIYEQLL
jgi:hypothetical protein